MALMGNAEIVAAGQQDKILSINMIRGIVTKKVRNTGFLHQAYGKFSAKWTLLNEYNLIAVTVIRISRSTPIQKLSS